MKIDTAHRHRILLADDQQDIRESLRLLLKNEGYETYAAASPSEALVAIEAREFDAVLMDLNYTRDTTSGREGLDLLTAIQKVDSTLPVIVMTAWSSLELAVEAMRLGARDFLQKPWENARLLSILRTQIDLRQALRRATRLEAENRLLSVESRPTLIAESESMQPVLNLIGRSFHAAGTANHRPHRTFRCQRSDHRGTRHRQGSGCADPSRAVGACQPPHGHRECRRLVGGRV